MKLFTKKNYSKLMIIPLILLIIFAFFIFITPGIEKGIDLKGGNQIIVHYDQQKDYSNLEQILKIDYGFEEVYINETKNINEYGLLIQFSLDKDIETAKSLKSELTKDLSITQMKDKSEEILTPLINKGYLTENDLEEVKQENNYQDISQAVSEKLSIANSNFNSLITSLLTDELDLKDNSKIQIREVSATLGQDFVDSAIKVGITAFVLLILVILLFFREIIPSGLIIFAAIFDIFAALFGMVVFNISLSLTTIPALLMLIGYSVDTDILLTTRILKQKDKNPLKSANDSIKTGLTMTITTISTIFVMLIISYLTQMLVVYEIAIILLCGLVGDLISTWFFNAPALVSYTFKKNK